MKTYIVSISLVALAMPLLLMNAPVSTSARQLATQQSLVVQAIAPVYPPIAASAGASGRVIIEAQVDSKGIVTSVRIVEGLKLLGKVSEDSARRWVFAPANEQTNVRVVRLTFTFKLMPDSAAPEDLVSVFMPPYQIEVRRTRPKVIDTPNVDPPMSNSRRPGKKKREPR